MNSIPVIAGELVRNGGGSELRRFRFNQTWESYLCA
jgi:hypothetical protein